MNKNQEELERIPMREELKKAIDTFKLFRP